MHNEDNYRIIGIEIIAKFEYTFNKGGDMGRVILLMLIFLTLVSAKIVEVEKWDSLKAYEGQEIVYYPKDNQYYLAQSMVKADAPDTGKSWVKIAHFRDAKEFKSDSLYQAGSVIKYEGKILVARHIAGNDGKLPNKDDDWGAWVMATGAIATLPPMPTAEEDSTIAGVDRNGDGNRDDIEIAVVLAAPNNPKVRAALLGFAKGATNQLETYDSLSNPTFVDIKFGYTLMSVAGSGIFDYETDNYLYYFDFLKIIVNTPERYLVDRKIDGLCDGKGFPNYGFPEYIPQAETIYNKIILREEER